MALAMLDQLSSPVFKPMWSALQRSLGTAKDVSDSNRNLSLEQMHFVYRVAFLKHPGMLSFEVPGLHEEAKRFRVNCSKTESSSPLETKVHKFLIDFVKDRGISLERSVWCGKSERIIDMTLCRGDRRVAIEADGPSHFIKTADGEYELNGQTRLRNRLLESAGWHVVSVRSPEKNSIIDMQTLSEDILALIER